MPPAQTAPTSKTIRLIHAAMVTGVILFAIVCQFVLKPTMANAPKLPPVMIRTLLGVALGAGALSFVLRRRVPKRASDESVDLYWTKAAAPALVTWASLEGASLLAIFLYVRTGEQLALAVAAAAVLVFVALNPASLERP